MLKLCDELSRFEGGGTCQGTDDARGHMQHTRHITQAFNLSDGTGHRLRRLIFQL
jgi:hypothetical protein